MKKHRAITATIVVIILLGNQIMLLNNLYNWVAFVVILSITLGAQIAVSVIYQSE